METINNISWVNGLWGTSSQLTLPINDRSLHIGDGIFETIMILDGSPKLFNAHINRWEKSAKLLQMATPPKSIWIRTLIQEAISKLSSNDLNYALRINWSRGQQKNRGISISNIQNQANNHIFWLELYAYEPCFHPLSTIISSTEQRNANSLVSQIKTFSYAQSIQARNEAQSAHYDEALLASTTGEICCGATANLVIKREDFFLTPRLTSGCLPGVMRQAGLMSEKFKESKLSIHPKEKDEWFLINSLSCRPITCVGNIPLTVATNPQELWYSLLAKSS